MHFLSTLIILGLLIMFALFLAKFVLTLILIIIAFIMAGVGALWKWIQNK